MTGLILDTQLSICVLVFVCLHDLDSLNIPQRRVHDTQRGECNYPEEDAIWKMCACLDVAKVHHNVDKP